MPARGRTQADLLAQRSKLADSYKELLDEFSSSDLRSVGNYTLGRLIGKGSFGKVYLGSHKLIRASKVVLKSANKDDVNLAREIHHHRQFLHPHIARLYEVIVTEKLVWLVLEYCPGDELYNYLLKTGPMDVAKVQKIFTQLVGAVSYVHNKSCVHRDLKLENILLDKNENVKLVDFGFTREYEGKTSYLQTWCGTVCYSAPEMVKGEKYAGEKVDVWSLGIILYALLCGELPFDDDDDVTTKNKILKEEPKFPDGMPQPAKNLISALLSKRPLLRPSLADVLTNPWLSEHAPQQQAILKLKQPAAFSTELEKTTLMRLKSVGINIDQVIENVLAQRCDPLAGWWALMLEKEERKEEKRLRKRKEREREIKAQRRISAASSRLDRLAPTITELDEEGTTTSGTSTVRQRGRSTQRKSNSFTYPTSNGSIKAPGQSFDLLSRSLPDLPKGVELENSPPPVPPFPKADKGSLRSESSSRLKPPLPPKEVRRRSGVHQVNAKPILPSPNGIPPKKQRRHQKPFLSQLASLKNWLMESAKRARSPYRKRDTSKSPKGKEAREGVQHTPDKAPTLPLPTSPSDQKTWHDSLPRLELALGNDRNDSEETNRPTDRPSFSPHNSSPTQRARISITTSPSPAPRVSLSPSPMPLTPRSSYRRATGLRGRKSTSSSISSIHSIHHQYTHSKTSSTSSTSASVTSPVAYSAASRARLSRSPHSSIKILPATPTTATAFPSNIRLARTSPSSSSSSAFAAAASEGRAAFGALPSPTPGLVFARRKRTAFKGPMLTIGSGMSSFGSVGGAAGRPVLMSRSSSGEGVGVTGAAGGRSASVQGRRSGEIIQEEEEGDVDGGGRAGGDGIRNAADAGDGYVLNEDDDEDVEIVDTFSPLTGSAEVVAVIDADGKLTS